MQFCERDHIPSLAVADRSARLGWSSPPRVASSKRRISIQQCTIVRSVCVNGALWYYLHPEGVRAQSDQSDSDVGTLACLGRLTVEQMRQRTEYTARYD
jgi:hypothetical protein